MSDDLVTPLRNASYLAFEDGTNDYTTAPKAAYVLEAQAARIAELEEETQNLQDDLASNERERAHQHSRADRNSAEYAREQAKREALQKRIAKLETALRVYECSGKCANCYGAVRNTKYCGQIARAALEGGEE